MGKLDQISSIFWLSLGLVVIYFSYRLGFGTPQHPGSGFLPLLAGVILCGFSASVFFQGRKARRVRGKGDSSQLWTGMAWLKPAYIVIALLVYAMAFESLGFLLATPALLIYLLKGVEPETWPRAVVTALVVTIISYALFGVWLQIQFPRGFLERLLF
jgi:hypothetical protein